MKDFLKTTLAIMAVGMFTLSGCAEPSGDGQFSEVSEHDNEQPNEDPHAGHAHPSHGPHGGDLIELGNEEYHAELIHPHGHDDDAHHDDGPEHAHDDDGEEHHKGEHDADAEGHQEDSDHDHAAHEHAGIVIYILDGAATEQVAIEAAEITLNLTHDGEPVQFKLAANPDSDDAAGKSSRFSSAEKALLELFHEAEHVEGTLVLSIGGKSYRGGLSHDHAHGDEHGHGEHAGEHAH
jgi:hypothetical protein